jgi:hypothetical protein
MRKILVNFLNEKNEMCCLVEAQGADVKGRRRGDVTPFVQVRGSMKNEKEHRENSHCTYERRPKTK